MYLADWSESKLEGIKSDFKIDYVDGEVIFAAYTYEDYSGDAFVLIKKGEQLYEVNGGHCSCYGLEDQWEPEETTKDALLHRLQEARYGLIAEYSKEIKSVLESL